MNLFQRLSAWAKDFFLEPIPPPEADLMTVYRVDYVEFCGQRQYCVISPAGWPLSGHGDDGEAARVRAHHLNVVATERIAREKEARRAEQDAIQQRRAALKLVKDDDQMKMEA